MLKRQLIATILMLVMFFAAHPQDRGKDYTDAGAYRVEQCEKYCSYPAPLGEAVLNANNLFQKDAPGSSRILVRVCSKESLPIAIATAAIEPDDVLRLTHGFEASAFKVRSENVVVGRSENCSGKSPDAKSLNPTPAELWAIPENVPLPPVVESIKACQIKTRLITTGGNENADIRLSHAVRFRKSLDRLIAELKDNPQAIGFVLGYHRKNETKLMRTRLREAERLLVKSGLPATRYVIRAMPQLGYDATEADAEHLSVKTVQIMPECSPTVKEREVLIAK